MGINQLLQELKGIGNKEHLSKYQGQSVAVDGYGWLYRGAYSCCCELGREEKTTKYVDHFMNQVRCLQRNNINPIIIFDGQKLGMKSITNDKRRIQRKENKEMARQQDLEGNVHAAREYYQRAITVTIEMAQNVQQSLKREEIQFIVAPYEADAQMAYLALNNMVSAVITEDSDMLAYGCPCVLFKFDKDKQTVIEFKIKENLRNNVRPRFDGFDQQMFLEYCILCGCDFLEKPQNFGPKAAHLSIREHKNFAKACSDIRNKGKYKLQEDHELIMQLSIWVFKHQVVYCPRDMCHKYLNPLPEIGLRSNVHEIQTKLMGLAIFENNKFLGEIMPQDLAQKFSQGIINPQTMGMINESGKCIEAPLSNAAPHSFLSGRSHIPGRDSLQAPLNLPFKGQSLKTPQSLPYKQMQQSDQRLVQKQRQQQSQLLKFGNASVPLKASWGACTGLQKNKGTQGQIQIQSIPYNSNVEIQTNKINSGNDSIQYGRDTQNTFNITGQKNSLVGKQGLLDKLNQSLYGPQKQELQYHNNQAPQNEDSNQDQQVSKQQVDLNPQINSNKQVYSTVGQQLNSINTLQNFQHDLRNTSGKDLLKNGIAQITERQHASYNTLARKLDKNYREAAHAQGKSFKRSPQRKDVKLSLVETLQAQSAQLQSLTQFKYTCVDDNNMENDSNAQCIYELQRKSKQDITSSLKNVEKDVDDNLPDNLAGEQKLGISKESFGNLLSQTSLDSSYNDEKLKKGGLPIAHNKEWSSIYKEKRVAESERQQKVFAIQEKSAFKKLDFPLQNSIKRQTYGRLQSKSNLEADLKITQSSQSTADSNPYRQWFENTNWGKKASKLQNQDKDKYDEYPIIQNQITKKLFNDEILDIQPSNESTFPPLIQVSKEPLTSYSPFDQRKVLSSQKTPDKIYKLLDYDKQSPSPIPSSLKKTTLKVRKHSFQHIKDFKISQSQSDNLKCANSTINFSQDLSSLHPTIIVRSKSLEPLDYTNRRKSTNQQHGLVHSPYKVINQGSTDLYDIEVNSNGRLCVIQTPDSKIKTLDRNKQQFIMDPQPSSESLLYRRCYRKQYNIETINRITESKFNNNKFIQQNQSTPSPLLNAHSTPTTTDGAEFLYGSVKSQRLSNIKQMGWNTPKDLERRQSSEQQMFDQIKISKGCSSGLVQSSVENLEHRMRKNKTELQRELFGVEPPQSNLFECSFQKQKVKQKRLIEQLKHKLPSKSPQQNILGDTNDRQHSNNNSINSISNNDTNNGSHQDLYNNKIYSNTQQDMLDVSDYQRPKVVNEGSVSYREVIGEYTQGHKAKKVLAQKAHGQNHHTQMWHQQQVEVYEQKINNRGKRKNFLNVPGYQQFQEERAKNLAQTQELVSGFNGNMDHMNHVRVCAENLLKDQMHEVKQNRTHQASTARNQQKQDGTCSKGNPTQPNLYSNSPTNKLGNTDIITKLVTTKNNNTGLSQSSDDTSTLSGENQEPLLSQALYNTNKLDNMDNLQKDVINQMLIQSQDSQRRQFLPFYQKQQYTIEQLGNTSVAEEREQQLAQSNKPRISNFSVPAKINFDSFYDDDILCQGSQYDNSYTPGVTNNKILGNKVAKKFRRNSHKKYHGSVDKWGKENQSNQLSSLNQNKLEYDDQALLQPNGYTYPHKKNQRSSEVKPLRSVSDSQLNIDSFFTYRAAPKQLQSGASQYFNEQRTFKHRKQMHFGNKDQLLHSQDGGIGYNIAPNKKQIVDGDVAIKRRQEVQQQYKPSQKRQKGKRSLHYQ